MMKKTLTATLVGALALGGAALTPAEAATALTSVNALHQRKFFLLRFPASATIGQLYLGNAGSASGNLPSGTRFYVTVEDMSGAPVRNTSLTLTTPHVNQDQDCSCQLPTPLW